MRDGQRRRATGYMPRNYQAGLKCYGSLTAFISKVTAV